MTASQSSSEPLGLSRRDIGEKQFYHGTGCDACNNTGYKGRKGIYELLKITDPIRELINERAPSVVLKEKAVELGMVTLRQDGLRSIFDGGKGGPVVDFGPPPDGGGPANFKAGG